MKAPITKRVHFLREPQHIRTECGKLHNQLDQNAKYVLYTTSDPDRVTCEPCLEWVTRDLDSIKNSKTYKQAQKAQIRKVFKVKTYTDFGQAGRIEEIGKHYNIATAMRQYARIWEVYGRRGGARVWQKMISPEK
jgi:hypothetical protein